MAETERRRVVVTGMGTVVTPLGLDVASSWEGVVEGRSGVVPISTFDTTGYPCRIAGEVRGFDPTDYFDAKDVRRTDRFVQFSLVATQEALRDADLEVTEERADHTGVYIGTGIGGLITLTEQIKVLDERGVRRVSPFLVPMMIADMASGQVSIDVGARGPNMGIVSCLLQWGTRYRGGLRGNSPGRCRGDDYRRHRRLHRPHRTGRLLRFPGADQAERRAEAGLPAF